MNPADFREGLELWSTPEINGKSMLDITVIAFSSKSPGTKYLFVGRSQPVFQLLHCSGTKKFGTNRPWRHISADCLYEFGKARTLPFETQIQRGALGTNESLVEMPCVQNPRRRSRMVRRPTLRTVPEQGQLGHTTDFLSGQSRSDSDARCIGDSPLCITFKQCLMNKSRLCDFSKAFVCHARSKHYASERA